MQACPTGIISAQHIIPIRIGIQNPEAVFLQVGRAAVAAAAIPVADDEVRIDRALILDVIIVEAVIERHGGHTGALDHCGDRVHVGDEIIVHSIPLEPLKARSRSVILVRAHVEVLAALVGKIINVLLQKGFRKGYRLGVGHVDGGLGPFVRQPARTGQGLRRGEDRIHVSGGIHQRYDGNAVFLGVSNDAIHLAFGQLTAACSRVSFISGLDGGLHYFMAKAALNAVRNAAHYVFFTSSQSQFSCENSFLSGGFCLC